jgi:hypothetical protein
VVSVGLRRMLPAVLSVAAGMLALASQAWSCASLAAVELTPSVVRPGQEVAVKVTFVNKDKPVELRWNGLNGPLLATIEPATFTEGLHGNWRFANGKITVPADAKAGNHLLVASQEAVKGTNTWGMPARALVQVSDGSPILGQTLGPPPVARPGNLVTEKSLSAGHLLIVGLGAAGVTMLVAGIGIVLAAGRQSRSEAATVRSGTAR